MSREEGGRGGEELDDRTQKTESGGSPSEIARRGDFSPQLSREEIREPALHFWESDAFSSDA
jgi:hypothetical protein